MAEDFLDSEEYKQLKIKNRRCLPPQDFDRVLLEVEGFLDSEEYKQLRVKNGRYLTLIQAKLRELASSILERRLEDRRTFGAQTTTPLHSVRLKGEQNFGRFSMRVEDFLASNKYKELVRKNRKFLPPQDFDRALVETEGFLDSEKYKNLMKENRRYLTLVQAKLRERVSSNSLREE